jgi:hypothetical protein
MVIRWTKPAADDLAHISDYTLSILARHKAAVRRLRFMRPPIL